MIETVEHTASTNADMLERAGQGAPEGLWLRALRQTGGRGRMGREWKSPEGNLFASTIVRLAANDPAAQGLAFVAGLAAHDAIASFLPEPVAPVLKWPNDVLVNGAKICGILLERRDDAVIAGFGINVAVAPEVPGRQTVALAEYDRDADAGAVLERLADGFARMLAEWRQSGLPMLLQRWQRHAHRPGQPLMVTIGEGQALSGVYDGLDDDGALRLRLENGSVRIVTAGDVEMIR
ncbi:MAG: biotin--[acetyl-CoA-carboxylase] ligase [Blastomonas sp.]